MSGKSEEFDMNGKRVEKIWKENEKLSEELANSYYQSVLDDFEKHIDKNSNEVFGFNTFAKGIRLGLDVTMPHFDDSTRAVAIRKIESIIRIRDGKNKKSRNIAKGTKSLTVKCDFCGGEIDCPEKMMGADKHVCAVCFQKPGPELKKYLANGAAGRGGRFHIDSDMFQDAGGGDLLDDLLEDPDEVVRNLVERIFPNTWGEHKEEMNAMSKRELAQKMFAMGAYAAIDFIGFLEMCGALDEDDEDSETQKKPPKAKHPKYSKEQAAS